MQPKNINSFPDCLVIQLGQTKTERLKTLSRIKDSAAAAIFSLIENDLFVVPESVEVLKIIYCEANYLEKKLSDQ